jgi:hypothetical protein
MEVLKMSIVQTLTEGIVQRDMQKEGQALLNKWSQTGLLEGITDERQRSSMARLLENQAKELLRESSSMAGGDVEGFAAVAFPIVRRVFAGLIANDLVSVQPMSLPSGLIFFLDFTVSTDGAGLPRLGYGNPTGAEESIYGGNQVGAGIADGINIGGANAERGPYNLNNGYASPTASVSSLTPTIIASGTFGAGGELDKLVQFDPELTSGSSNVVVGSIDWSTEIAAGSEQWNADDMVAIVASGSAGFARGVNAGDVQLRRLTRFSGSSTTELLVVMASYDGSRDADQLSASLLGTTDWSYPQKDNIEAGGALGSVVGDTVWGLELSLPQSFLSKLLLKSIVKSLKTLSKVLRLVLSTGLVLPVFLLIVLPVLKLVLMLLLLTSPVPFLNGMRPSLKPSMMYLLKSTERHFVVVQTSSFVAQKLLTFLNSLLDSALTLPLTLTKAKSVLLRLVLLAVSST